MQRLSKHRVSHLCHSHALLRLGAGIVARCRRQPGDRCRCYRRGCQWQQRHRLKSGRWLFAYERIHTSARARAHTHTHTYLHGRIHAVTHLESITCHPKLSSPHIHTYTHTRESVLFIGTPSVTLTLGASSRATPNCQPPHIHDSPSLCCADPVKSGEGRGRRDATNGGPREAASARLDCESSLCNSSILQTQTQGNMDL